MPDEKEKKEETASEEPQKPASKSKGPLFLIIIGAVVFVAAIGIFSLTMGVLSSPPTADEGSEAATKQQEAVKSETSNEGQEDDDLTEMEKLEKELFQAEDVSEADDLDDLMALVEEEEKSEKPGMSEEDSIEAVKWLDEEKAKLAEERSELKALKKDLDRQEYRLKQLIAKTSQVESARINSLAKLYDGMKAAQVAPLINKLTEEQAVQILLKMKPANAAKLLGSLSPDRAARISARMITLSEE
jgi:flagellar motility protein MotE (MotC chaperone)